MTPGRDLRSCGFPLLRPPRTGVALSVNCCLRRLPPPLLHRPCWPGVFHRVVGEARRAEDAGADHTGFGMAGAKAGAAVGAFSTRGARAKPSVSATEATSMMAQVGFAAIEAICGGWSAADGAFIMRPWCVPMAPRRCRVLSW